MQWRLQRYRAVTRCKARKRSGMRRVHAEKGTEWNPTTVGFLATPPEKYKRGQTGTLPALAVFVRIDQHKRAKRFNKKQDPPD
ncbi:hypothetical protein ACTMU2_34515 [Cupriavidus basilensis]